MMADSPFPLTQGIEAPYSTQIPDVILDRFMAHLSGAEFKVLLYIARRTFGFRKTSDDISLDQICHGITKRDGDILDEGTGLSMSTVCAAIKSLGEKNVILTLRHRSLEKGDEPTSYCLNLRGMSPPSTIFGEGVSENRRRGAAEIEDPRLQKSKTQHTVRQHTVEQESPLPPQRGERPIRRRRRAEEPADYSHGAYGVCPECGMKPHDPECPVLAREAQAR